MILHTTASCQKPCKVKLRCVVGQRIWNKEGSFITDKRNDKYYFKFIKTEESKILGVAVTIIEWDTQYLSMLNTNGKQMSIFLFVRSVEMRNTNNQNDPTMIRRSDTLWGS